MQKYKGPIEACQILALLRKDFPTIRLVMAGDGPFKKNVEKYAKKNHYLLNFWDLLKKKIK